MDKELLIEVKQYAAERGKTFTAVVEDALKEVLHRRDRQQRQPRRIRLSTVAGRGLQAGVDLDDSAALMEFMDADVID